MSNKRHGCSLKVSLYEKLDARDEDVTGSPLGNPTKVRSERPEEESIGDMSALPTQRNSCDLAMLRRRGS